MAAGVGIEAGRAVESEQGAAVALGQPVGGGDQLGMDALRRPAKANAEQAIDDQRPAAFIRNAVQCRSASCDKALVSGSRIAWQGHHIAGKGDPNIEKPLAEQAGDLEGIATIVARAGQDQDRTLAVAGEFASPIGCGQAGTLHQRRSRVGLFDLAQRGAQVKCLRFHGGLQASCKYVGMRTSRADGGTAIRLGWISSGQPTSCGGIRESGRRTGRCR
jgi:hypothetical protein